MSEDIERDEAVREHAACPECTANRGEFCRDVAGAEVPTHESRVERYERENDHAEDADDDA